MLQNNEKLVEEIFGGEFGEKGTIYSGTCLSQSKLQAGNLAAFDRWIGV